MPEIRTAVQEIFRIVFDDPALVLRDEMSAKDFEQWDSLQHINIIIAIEEKLRIRFTMMEISQLAEPDENVGMMLRILEQKFAAN